MWSAIGNVEFNCQMASHHVPRFHLWCYKHNFTATDDNSGSRNGLRKVQLVFCLTGTTLFKGKGGQEGSQGRWKSLTLYDTGHFYMCDHCNPNPQV